MYLTTDEQSAFSRDGYLFWPSRLQTHEIEALRADVPLALATSPHPVLEKDGTTLRSVYGVQATETAFARLCRHQFLAGPAQDVLGSLVYVHQYKINAKVAFGGDVWEWHQDYIFWRNEDGMPSARVVTACVFLDEVTEFNGPMLLIPGSHREGVVEQDAREAAAPSGYEAHPAWIGNLTAKLKYGLDRSCVERLVSRYGIVAPKGPAGSILLFHSNLVHGSAANMSPFDRMVALITYNSVENTLRSVARPRPEFLASRDYRPVQVESPAEVSAFSALEGARP
jgi:ectoine hydroxylase-related dioxygenase (phytanoyl-CoA dioxygenase family)